MGAGRRAIGLGLALSVLILLLVPPATPFQHATFGGKPVRWSSVPVTLHHDPATMKETVVAELLAAMAVWSSVPATDFRYLHGGPSPSSDVHDTDNGVSDVSFDMLSSAVYSVTFINVVGGSIRETDVVFNQAHQWTTKATNTPTGPADVRTVAIHELGHALGLLHEWTRPSVMAGDVNPAFARHALYPDDEAGVRFLYPGPGGPTGPDLAVDEVGYEPVDAVPGDEILVTYTIANQGSQPSGSFAVDMLLTGGTSPAPGDPRLAAWTMSSLSPGVGRTGDFRTILPAELLPGTYHVALVVDPILQVPDADRANNTAVSSRAVRVEREALEVPIACRVLGDLGPAGRDILVLELMEGTPLRIKAKQSPGALSLSLLGPDATAPSETSKVSRRVKLKVKVGASGPYRVHLDSAHLDVASYEVKVRAKSFRRKGEVTIDGPVTIPLRLHAGTRVRVKVKGRDSFRPTVEIPGVDAEVRIGRGGTRVTLGPFTEETDGIRLVVLDGVDGVAGTAVWRVDVEPPREGPELTR